MDVRRDPKEPPDPPPPQPPKGNAPPSPSPGTDLISLGAENGTALAIVHGTARVTPNLVERYIYQFISTVQIGSIDRLKSTTYALGVIRSNFGKFYVVAAPGTTGTGNGPFGTGAGQTDGTVTWDYAKAGYRHQVMLALCEGQIFGAGKAWQDKNVFAAYTDMPHDSVFFSLALGTPTGGRPTSPPFFNTPGAIADVYGNTAVLYAQLSTGSDADLPAVEIEVKGIGTGVSTVDVNPADIAIDLLTHARRGAGRASAFIAASSTDTSAASWRTYARAAGFILSWVIDSQQSALTLLKLLCAVTNTDMVMTNRLDGLGMMVKFVPLGTDSITANGVTFTPNLTPVYAVGADDLLEPLSFDIKPETEIFNSWPIEYIDRASDYKNLTVDDPDMADVDVRGLVRANTTKIPMVMAPEAAVQLSRIKAQRSLNVRNTYRLRLGWRFLLAEPTDIITPTDTLLGMIAQPTRVTVFEESDQETGDITLTCEDFPAAVGAAPGYTPQANDGFKPTVSSALTSLVLLPGQAPKLVVADSVSTRGAAVDNLWPNFNSELDPPDGADTSVAEWLGRSQAVTPYSGAWTRTPGLGASLEIPCDVAAAPDETYYIEAQVKAAVAAANKGGLLKITAFDKDGTSLGTASSSVNDTTTYAKLSTSLLMPANTVRVRLSLLNGTDANAQAYFDVMYARKAIDSLITVPPVFQTPTLATHYTHADFAYWKTVDRAVRFKGQVNFDGNAAAQNQVVFTLPAGFRPLVHSEFVISTSVLGTHILVTIETNGDVRFQEGSLFGFTSYPSAVNFQLA